MFTLPTITNVYATSAEVSWCETHLSLGVVKQAFTPHLSESAKHFLSVSLWLKSIEDINKDLVEYAAWDMVQPVASVALIVKDDDKSSC